MSADKSSGKIVPLEALRGLAAIGVVFHHFVLGFLPQLANIVPAHGVEGRWVGSPLFLLINGKAMVIIFFVLSGHVLALKGARPDAKRALANAAVKRWFRLVPLICISLLASYALFMLGLYHYDDVYALNGARMFNHYAHHPQTYHPSFAAILYEGMFGALFLGEDSFNTVIWSMQPEFYGSMMVFCLALLLAPGRHEWLNLALVLAGILLFKEAIWFFPFLFGVLGVAQKLEQRRPGNAATYIVLALSLYLCGYYRPQGWYGWLAGVPLPELTLRVLMNTLGGYGLLVVFATGNPVSRRFSGMYSRWLGQASFSLYLIHTLILASLSAWAYAHIGGSTPGVLAAAAVFLIATPPFVYLMARFDEWWMGLLSRWHPI